MGAAGTWIGRAYIYGLGAMGQQGVTRALELLHKELDVSMALCGRRRIEELDRDVLLIPRDFEGTWQTG
jgi:L-lactate dehydrogenase (cytochrome)